ncbi:MAG: WYL domain-containing protein [Polyangiaceae bacterium]|nr:WYL domain-containing protein [Polyangiaceae bacterium]
MGQQNRYKSVTRVFQAFAEQRTWKQAELARDVGISADALRTLLQELQASGMKLHQESEPPQVYWSVPKGWFPGGILLSDSDFPTLLRAAFELPESTARTSLLKKILGTQGHPEATELVLTREGNPREDLAYEVVQKALVENKALQLLYLTQSRGVEGSRVVSPQKLVTRPHPRLLAWCHQTCELRWFRLDNVLSASLGNAEAFVTCSAEAVKRVLKESVDGFHGSEPEGSEELAFFVRHPEASWVKKNLLSSMRVDARGSTSEGIRIVCGRRGAPVVARFVVGLGAAARAEGPLLKAQVVNLAEESLRVHTGGVKRTAGRTPRVSAVKLAAKGKG